MDSRQRLKDLFAPSNPVLDYVWRNGIRWDIIVSYGLGPLGRRTDDADVRPKEGLLFLILLWGDISGITHVNGDGVVCVCTSHGGSSARSASICASQVRSNLKTTSTVPSRILVVICKFLN